MNASISEVLYLQKGKVIHKQAKESVLKAIYIDPKLAAAFSSLSLICRANGELTEAKKYAIKAIQINSSLASNYSNLGLILQDEGKTKEAKDCVHEKLVFVNAHTFGHVRNII